MTNSANKVQYFKNAINQKRQCWLVRSQFEGSWKEQ